MEHKIAEESRLNPKVFWNYVNRNMKLKPKVESIREADGRYAHSDRDKCVALSNFFQSVFTREDVRNIPIMEDRHCGQILEEVSFTREEVKLHLQRLKPNKAPGLDGFHPRLLKECASSLCGPLQMLFQKSIEAGELPDAWKNAVVKPIFKKGDKHSVGNYRPVSLTSIVSKVMESLVKRAVLDHLLTNGLLSEVQYGFIPGKSCEAQLLSCTDLWTLWLEEGHSVDVVYTDFRKAFDAVPHQRLLVKLKAYGLGDKIMKWMGSFLCGRKQCVSINGVTSDWAEVTSGIPQGSVLGPLCFLLYVNDLPDVIEHSSIMMFADDAKIFGQVTTVPQRANIQSDLDNILAWTQLWQLPLNIEKCAVMHLGNKNQLHQFTLGNITLKNIVTESDLGVLMDSELKFHPHVAKVLKKCKSLLAIIKRSFACLNKRIVTKLYKAMIRPVIEYGNSVWGPFYKGDQVMLEKLQRRITKMVPDLSQLSYPERLKLLNIPTLKYRRTRGDMIMLYKMMTNKMKTHFDLEWAEHGRQHRTRGHSRRLRKILVRKQVRRNHLTVRAVNRWNSLPEAVVSAATTNSFKNLLDKFLKDDMYRMD